MHSSEEDTQPVNYLTKKIRKHTKGSEDMPDISIEEINYAVGKMKNNTAQGGYDIAIEAIQVGNTILSDWNNA